MMCLCQHGTEGRNCESCLPDHWERPWRRATAENAWECKREYLSYNFFCIRLITFVPDVFSQDEQKIKDTFKI